MENTPNKGLKQISLTEPSKISVNGILCLIYCFSSPLKQKYQTYSAQTIMLFFDSALFLHSKIRKDLVRSDQVFVA